jgi:group I intron endonuclease
MKNIFTNNPSSIIPVKSYSNAFINKNAILLENKNKSGIYLTPVGVLINKLNGNSYVGSGLNLAKRVGDYYKESELKRNPRPIHAALLKHGHTNFTLEILEYCKADELIEREQHYLDRLRSQT